MKSLVDPIEIANRVQLLYNDIHGELKKLLYKFYDNKFVMSENDCILITLRSIIGKPFVYELCVSDNDILYRTATKNKNGIQPSSGYYKLHDDDLLSVYTDLYTITCNKMKF